MEKTEAPPSSNGETEKEGKNLLGEPTFTKLDNGRFKCIETGHELPDHAKESYSQSKRCRIGLINFALANKISPLNMFKQDPLNSSKLICNLTGDTINKSEEHIWKHISGKRFFNKLEEMEASMLAGKGDVESESIEQVKGLKGKGSGAKEKKKEKVKKEEKKEKEEIVSELRDPPAHSDCDSEEDDFWMPPAGERWDFDDGGDRWGSDSESGDQHVEDDGAGKYLPGSILLQTKEAVELYDVEKEEDHNVSSELSTRTKRMSIEIGPSNFASRKKKSKTKSS